MRADFIGFEKVYADTSNREMLLNLARLQNRDPTYFFKLGQISSSYIMGATLSGAGNYTIPTSGIGGNATGGGAPGVSFSNSPSFTFIPVNDQTNAQLLLQPVAPETFYILYQQGWRADQLFRLMVDRIEFTYANPATGCAVEILRNTPPEADPGGTATTRTYTRNAEVLSSYATFLRISAIIYELQKNGFLLLRGTNKWVPYDKNMLPDSEKPKASDVAKSASVGESWQMIPDDSDPKKPQKLAYGKIVFNPVFYLNPVLVNVDKGETTFVPDKVTIESKIKLEPGFQGLANGPVLEEVISAIAGGFSIDGGPNANSEAKSSCNPKDKGSPRIVMRSLLGMMAAAAQEEEPFQTLVASNPAIPPSPYLAKYLNPTTDAYKNYINYVPHFVEGVPTVEQMAALHMLHDEKDRHTPALVQVDYRGRGYSIADLVEPKDADNLHWNRDMFRLLSQLVSQVTVDISKFPLPDILQLHTTN